MKVIDPEFCFAGDPAFDVAVMAAHLLLADAAGDVPAFLDAYGRGPNPTVLARLAGCEVMRRLIGVAQLPIPRTTGRRAELLERARRAVTGGDFDTLLA